MFGSGRIAVRNVDGAFGDSGGKLSWILDLFDEAVQTFTGDHVPELQEQPDQPVTPPRLTGKIITIGVN